MAKKKNRVQPGTRPMQASKRSLKELKPIVAVGMASFGIHMALAEILLENNMQSGVLIACLTPLLAWGCITEKRRNLLTLAGAICAICIGTILPGVYLVSRRLWWGIGAFGEGLVLFGTLFILMRKLKK